MADALASTSPLFAIPLEIWILRQWPTTRTILGAVLTVAGITCMGF